MDATLLKSQMYQAAFTDPRLTLRPPFVPESVEALRTAFPAEIPPNWTQETVDALHALFEDERTPEELSRHLTRQIPKADRTPRTVFPVPCGVCGFRRRVQRGGDVICSRCAYAQKLRREEARA